MATKRFSTLREEIEDYLGYLPIQPATDSKKIIEMIVRRLKRFQKNAMKGVIYKSDWYKGIERGIILSIDEVSDQ